MMMGSGGDGSEREVILGLVETHEKFNRMEWGEGVEYISTMRGQDNKRGGEISLIKGNARSDMLTARLNLWKLSMYIMLVYIDVKDSEINYKYI